MLRNRHISTGRVATYFAILLIFMLGPHSLSAQSDSCVKVPSQSDDYLLNFRHMKQRKITGLDIGGKFKGLLEYTPPGYNPADATTKYPVIIFFHGISGVGAGTETSLCQILYDGTSPYGMALPAAIEKGRFTPTVTSGGQDYSFIVISPQFVRYSFPGDYPTASHVSDVVDYVLANYEVDPSRVYLTGISSGANMVIEYAGSTLSAGKIAAVSAASLCSPYNSSQNVAAGITPVNIANQDLPVWFMQCITDDKGCAVSIPQDWVDNITDAGGVPPRFTILDNANTDPQLRCFTNFVPTGTSHNTWFRMYDETFTNDGGLPFANWLIQYSSTAVTPVRLKDYSATLSDGKVILKWTTVSETSNKSFTIERAGSDQVFHNLSSIPGSGNSSTEKKYSYTDDKPLSNLSFYRLVQTDIDGKRTVFGVKKIMNRKGGNVRLIVSPNPFTSEVSAFVNINRAQKVNIFLTDMSGRRISSQSANYTEGTVEIKLNTTGIPKGIYLLKVRAEDFSDTQKLIKQ